MSFHAPLDMEDVQYWIQTAADSDQVHRLNVMARVASEVPGFGSSEPKAVVPVAFSTSIERLEQLNAELQHEGIPYTNLSGYTIMAAGWVWSNGAFHDVLPPRKPDDLEIHSGTAPHDGP